MLKNLYTCLRVAALVCQRTLFGEQVGEGTDKVVATLENMKRIDTPYGRGRMSGQDLFGINHVIIRPFTLSRIMKDKIEFEFIKK